MRRLAILLVPVVGATVGSIVTAAPAGAEHNSLAEAHVIVAPPEPQNLLSVCITSDSLIPDGACLVI